MPEQITLNAGETSELDLIDAAAGLDVIAHDYPAPKPRPVYATSIDTEGALLVAETAYDNRTISLTVECGTQAALVALQEVVALIGREGGTLTYTPPSGTASTFELLTFDDFTAAFDLGFTIAGRTEVRLAFVARPFANGATSTLTDRVETTAPALIFTETSIPGDVPALARLVIDNDQAGVDQGWMIWGVRSRNYSSAASAALLIQAEDLTTQGGSTKTAGATGASGSGSNVVRNTDLTTTFVSILSGQLSASSTYLSHVGTYRVFARVYCPTGNTGNVDVALEWAEGDFGRVTRNAITRYDSAWEGSFRLIDLGVVSLTAVLQGTQRWEPRIIARSSVVGDEIDVDWLMFVPVDEASGEASVVAPRATATTFVVRDEFAHAAGALAGKTLPTGGTWSGTGDADDFQATGSQVTRATQADTAARLNVATSNYASVAVRCEVGLSLSDGLAGGVNAGIIARYVDANNHFRAFINDLGTTATQTFRVQKVVGGTSTTLATVTYPFGYASATTHRLLLMALPSGQWYAFVTPKNTATDVLVASGQDADLATGGTLATGRVGLVDFAGSYPTTPPTRYYDNLAAWQPVADAACFAQQSMEVRWDGVIREDSAGAIWTPVSSYEGDLARIPVTGPENRTVETIVKFSRNPPGLGADSGTDDLSARYTVTARHLVIPT